MKKIILGSQSPRRLEIFSHFNIPFERITPPFCEESIPYKGDPRKYVCELSQGKAESIARNHPQAIILTADTIVWKDGQVYGKPKDQKEAYETLKALSGSWHSVFTGVSVVHGDKSIHDFEETKVLFNPLTSDQIHHYHSSMDCFDKAGGYAIQMPGGLIVQKIEGCYYNVMGLPVNTVRKLLLEVGLDLWLHLK